jgi:alkaline phosphatase D
MICVSLSTAELVDYAQLR